jgi:hypothetical protein
MVGGGSSGGRPRARDIVARVGGALRLAIDPAVSAAILAG